MKEASYGTYPTNFGTLATIGLKQYFENWDNDHENTETDYKECTGAAASVDRNTFDLDPQDPRFTLDYAMRYSGVHAVLLGAAFGNLVTAGASPYTHTITMRDDTLTTPINTLPSYYFLSHTALIVPSSGATAYSEVQVSGAKCNTTRISMSADDGLLRCSQQFLASTDQWFTTVTNTANLPPDGTTTGQSPAEELIRSSHLKSANDAVPASSAMVVYVQGSATGKRNMRVRSFEINIDNKLSRDSFITYGGAAIRAGVQPDRSDSREVTATFTVDAESDCYDLLNEAAGYTANDTPKAATLYWDFLRPDDPTNYALSFNLSNAVVTRIQRGTRGADLQAMTFTVRAQAPRAGSSNWSIGTPIEMVMKNLRQGTGTAPGGTKYDTYV